MKKRYNFVDVIIIVILLLMSVTCLIPILNAIAISFSDKTAAALGQVYFVPKGFNMTSYIEIVKEGRFFTAFGVSVMRTVMGVLVNVTLCIFMAYPLSKGKEIFRAKNVYMWILVFTMLFNGGLVPTFMLIKSLGMLDTIWALVLPGAVPVFNLIILMNFYKGIPTSLEEAALVDGANPLYILTKIYVPLAKASIATIALFSMVNHWNAFFDGKIYINSINKQPLQTYIQSLTAQISQQALATMRPEEIIEKLKMSDLTFNSAKAIVSMVPIVAVYPFLQKYCVTGTVMGAVKE